MSGVGASYHLVALSAVAVMSFAAAQLNSQPPSWDLQAPFKWDNWVRLGEPKPMYIDDNRVILTTQLHAGAQRSAIWHKNPFNFRKQFEINMTTKITGEKGSTKTAQGMGLWIVERPQDADGNPIFELGNVYGSNDMFRGLGIVFDSLDDDKRRNNPSISAHYLDGTVPYSHRDDGVSHQLAGCVADYRRSDAVTTRVAFNGGNVTVHVNFGDKGGFKKCLDVPVPMRYDQEWFLGISAETMAGAKQETHEVLKLVSSGVTDPEWTMKQAQRSYDRQTQQQQQWQQPPPPSQQQNVPQQGQALDSADALHDKIDQLMKATTHTALESQQAGEALKEVQTNVLQKVHTSTNTLVQQIRTVSQSLSQHMSSTTTQMQALAKSIDSTKASVDSGRVDNERRANAIDAQIASLQETIQSVNEFVNQLSKSVKVQISREFSKGTARITAASTQGRSWNVWVFVILFQVMFVVVLVLNHMMKNKRDKLL